MEACSAAEKNALSAKADTLKEAQEAFEALVTTEPPPTTRSSLSPSPTVLSTTVPPSMTSHVMSVTRQTMTSRGSSPSSLVSSPSPPRSSVPSSGGSSPSSQGSSSPYVSISIATATGLSTTPPPLISSHMMSSHVMSVTRPRMTPMSGGRRKKASRGRRFY